MAGVVEPATLQAIERSELAHSVVGATAAETLEVSLLRARWHFLNGELPQALELLATIESNKDKLAPHIAGDSALLLGSALKAETASPTRWKPSATPRTGSPWPGPPTGPPWHKKTSRRSKPPWANPHAPNALACGPKKLAREVSKIIPRSDFRHFCGPVGVAR